MLKTKRKRRQIISIHFYKRYKPSLPQTRNAVEFSKILSHMTKKIGRESPNSCVTIPNLKQPNPRERYCTPPRLPT